MTPLQSRGRDSPIYESARARTPFHPRPSLKQAISLLEQLRLGNLVGHETFYRAQPVIEKVSITSNLPRPVDDLTRSKHDSTFS